MSKSITKKRNFYFIASILLVALSFSYYFLAYIPEREEEMNARGIREMNRMMDNIHEREDHYKKSMAMFECDYALGQVFELQDTSEMVNMLIYSECFWDSFLAKDSARASQIRADIEIYYNNYAAETADYEKAYKKFEKLSKALFVKNDILVKLKSSIKLDQIVELSTADKTTKENVNEFIIKYVPTKFDISDISTNDYSSEAILAIRPDKFLRDVKRFEFFQDIFVTDPANGLVIDSSQYQLRYFSYQPTSKIVKTEEVLPDGKEETNDFLDFDDSIKAYRISSVDIVERKISNKDYYCFTSLVKIDSRNYYLTGLISKEKYNEEIRSVSIWVVMISIVFLIFIILALPVAKPFILSKKERLMGSDITWAAVGLVFGMAAFILFIIGINTFAVEEIKQIDRKLSAYSNDISNQFLAEKTESISLLKHLSKIDTLSKSKFINHIKKTGLNKDLRLLQIDEKGNAFYFKLLTNADQNKDSIVTISKNLDLSHRAYYKVFKNADGHGVWQNRPDNDTYVIESVFSLSTGKHETVVALKPEKGFPLLALVSQFKSVNNIFLEPNYSFCIVDNRGVIQYHTDEAKIDNENLIQETNYDDRIQGYLNNNSSASLSLNFALNNYRANIKPIPGTPWHILTFYDIKKSRLTVTTSMAITFQIILGLLIYMLILHFLYKAYYSIRVRKGQKVYPYLFLNPINISGKTYLWLAIINSVLIFYLFLVYRSNQIDVLVNVFAFFAVITTSILFNYAILSRSFASRLNSLSHVPSPCFLGFEIVLIILSLVWIIASALFNLETGGYFWFLLLPLALLAMYFYYTKKFGTLLTEEPNNPKDSFRPFYLHTFSWVVMISVVPALLFFKPSFNQQNIRRSINNLQNEFETLVERGDSTSTKKVSLFHALPTEEEEPVEQSTASKQFVEIMSPYFNTDGKELKGQSANKAELDIVLLHEKSYSHEPYFVINLDPENPYHNWANVSESTIPAFNLPDVLSSDNQVYSILFWLIVLLSLYVLYYIITKLSQKFFYLDILTNINSLEPKECLVELDEHKNAGDNELVRQVNVMLVGPPYSGRNYYARNIIKKNDSIKYLDFLNSIPEEHKKLTKEFLSSSIILNNFDHRIFDFKHNQEKLNLLEELIRFRNENQIDKKLVIISSFGTSQLIEIYNEKIKTMLSKGEDVTELANDEYRWETIMHGFSKQVVPLESIETDNLVDKELGVGNGLMKLKSQVLAYQEKLIQNEERLSRSEINGRLISYIADVAQNYYFAIWNTCSKEEKFLLFDLAEDGLLNINNEQVLFDLVRKGILVANPTLQIFNQSFTQFITNVISEEEGTQMEREAISEGIWSTYKYLVIFIVLIIVIFLSFVEKQSFTKITGVISLGAMLLPNLIRMFNSVASSSRFFNKSA